MRAPIIAYNRQLREQARELRRRMTLGEVLLWKRLNRRQLLGYDFDRQRPLGNCIVDFYCKALRLAVEVDGSSHDFKEEKDLTRQLALERMGIRVVRVWDAEVRNDMESVLAHIASEVESREVELANPPRPPVGGRPSREGT